MERLERILLLEKEWYAHLFQDPTLWEEKTLSHYHFSSRANQHLFNCITKLTEEKQPIDTTSLSTMPEKEFHSFGGYKHLNEIKKTVFTPKLERFHHIEREIHTFYMANTLIEKIKPLETKDNYTLQELETLTQEINETVSDIQPKRQSFKELVQSTREKLNNVPDGLSGIDTGYKSLDDAFDGWQEGELIVIGARPSTGKTAFTVNLAIHSVKNGHIVNYIPAETGEESILKRMISVIGNLPVNAMKNPKKFLTPMQYNTYNKIIDKLEHTQNLFIEQIHDIGEIKQRARSQRKAYPDKKILFIIDHLGHLHNSKSYSSRVIEYEDYCKQIKHICNEYKISIILLSQLSRSVETRENKRPMSSDLRDSGGIEQIADVIAFLHRPNQYLQPEEKTPEDILEFIITKNRDGETGILPFQFYGVSNRVVEKLELK